jgi:hypothetical protein
MKKIIDIKYLGIPNICFSLTDPNDSREKGYSKQRKERGFDNSELWSLDSTITKFILPRLKVFREIQAGHPGCVKNEKEWNKILDKIIKAFEIADSSISGLISDEEYKDWKKGMNLFVKYYFCLWI